MREYADDPEITEKFEEAKLYSALVLYSLEPSLAARIKAAMLILPSAYAQEGFVGHYSATIRRRYDGRAERRRYRIILTS
jgi:hypothetical protein